MPERPVNGMTRTTAPQSSPSLPSLTVYQTTRCPTCDGVKLKRVVFCRRCWSRLPLHFRRGIYATRYKPIAHARAISVAASHLLYAVPEPELFD